MEIITGAVIFQFFNFDVWLAWAVGVPQECTANCRVSNSVLQTSSANGVRLPLASRSWLIISGRMSRINFALSHRLSLPLRLWLPELSLHHTDSIADSLYLPNDLLFFCFPSPNALPASSAYLVWLDSGWVLVIYSFSARCLFTQHDVCRSRAEAVIGDAHHRNWIAPHYAWP